MHRDLSTLENQLLHIDKFENQWHKSKRRQRMKDEKLQGNEKIEAAIEGLKKEPTQEMLALCALKSGVRSYIEEAVILDSHFVQLVSDWFCITALI